MSLAATNIQRQASAIVNLFNVIKLPEYAKILDEIKNVALSKYSRRVLMAGVGKNANIATKIAETMASLGIPSMPLNVSHLGHGDFGYIGHNDLIIHISRSGNTREMLVAIEHISVLRPFVTQVLIHCKPSKKPNPFVQYELCTGALEEGDEHGLAPTTSTTALLCLLDCLSVEASHAAQFKRIDFLNYHPDGALGEMLKKEQGTTLAVMPPDNPPAEEISTGMEFPQIDEALDVVINAQSELLSDMVINAQPEPLPDMDVSRLAMFLNNQPAQYFDEPPVVLVSAQEEPKVLPKTGSLFKSVAKSSFSSETGAEDMAERKIS